MMTRTVVLGLLLVPGLALASGKMEGQSNQDKVRSQQQAQSDDRMAAQAVEAAFGLLSEVKGANGQAAEPGHRNCRSDKDSSTAQSGGHPARFQDGNKLPPNTLDGKRTVLRGHCQGRGS